LRRQLAPDAPELADALDILGRVAKRQHRLDDATAMFREALAIDEKSGTRDRWGVEIDLGNVALESGRLDEAESWFRRAEKETREGSADPLELVPILENLAMVEHRRGRHASAHELYDRAVAQAEQAQGSESPRIASVLISYGEMLEADGDHAGARQRIARALAIREKTLGPDDPDTKEARDVLASLGR
jgi:tetratricopeptide (TPR) repeat protein